MSTVGTTPMSAEEFFAWSHLPENQDQLHELEEGEVVLMPLPSEHHGVICGLLAHLLWNYVFHRGKGYVCSNDTGLLVKRDPDSVRGPDIMLFDEKGTIEGLSRGFIERIPALLVEVLSPCDQMTKIN